VLPSHSVMPEQYRSDFREGAADHTQARIQGELNRPEGCSPHPDMNPRGAQLARGLMTTPTWIQGGSSGPWAAVHTQAWIQGGSTGPRAADHTYMDPRGAQLAQGLLTTPIWIQGELNWPEGCWTLTQAWIQGHSTSPKAVGPHPWMDPSRAHPARGLPTTPRHWSKGSSSGPRAADHTQAWIQWGLNWPEDCRPHPGMDPRVLNWPEGRRPPRHGSKGAQLAWGLPTTPRHGSKWAQPAEPPLIIESGLREQK
jgi:hypothetical protein